MEFQIELIEFQVYWNGVVYAYLNRVVVIGYVDVVALGRDPEILYFLPNIFADSVVGFPFVSGETSLCLHSILKLVVGEIWRSKHDAHEDHRSQNEQGQQQIDL